MTYNRENSTQTPPFSEVAAAQILKTGVYEGGIGEEGLQEVMQATNDGLTKKSFEDAGLPDMRHLVRVTGVSIEHGIATVDTSVSFKPAPVVSASFTTRVRLRSNVDGEEILQVGDMEFKPTGGEFFLNLGGAEAAARKSFEDPTTAIRGGFQALLDRRGVVLDSSRLIIGMGTAYVHLRGHARQPQG